MEIMDFFLEIIYPKYCLLCLKKGKYICDNCINKMDKYPGPICPVCKGILRSKNYFIHKICKRHSKLDGLFPYLKYDQNTKKILSEAKYKFGREIFFEIAKLLKPIYSNLPFKIDYLAPVPLNKKKLLQRGFNQSELMAKSISNKYKNLLIKNISTKSQAGSSRKERIKNIKGVFALRKDYKVKNKNIVLIDDVCTTGSTLFECAKELKANGAKNVYAIVWAKDEWNL